MQLFFPTPFCPRWQECGPKSTIHFPYVENAWPYLCSIIFSRDVTGVMLIGNCKLLPWLHKHSILQGSNTSHKNSSLVNTQIDQTRIINSSSRITGRHDGLENFGHLSWTIQMTQQDEFAKPYEQISQDIQVGMHKFSLVYIVACVSFPWKFIAYLCVITFHGIFHYQINMLPIWTLSLTSSGNAIEFSKGYVYFYMLSYMLLTLKRTIAASHLLNMQQQV